MRAAPVPSLDDAVRDTLRAALLDRFPDVRDVPGQARRLLDDAGRGPVDADVQRGLSQLRRLLSTGCPARAGG